MPPSKEEKSHDLTATFTRTTTIEKVNAPIDFDDYDDDDYDDEDDTSILLFDVADTGSPTGSIRDGRPMAYDGSYLSSQGFASHDDSVTFHKLYHDLVGSSQFGTEEEEDDGPVEDQEPHKTNDAMIDHHHHCIVLYYNSNTVTKTLSQVDVRNRLQKNLQFIQNVKARLEPFLDTNAKHFTIEYCDVADQGRFHVSLFIYIPSSVQHSIHH